jgi:hypothetical protein
VFPFSKFSNGTLIPSGSYRLFGAALPYPKDVVASGISDLNLYLSDPFEYRNEAAAPSVPTIHKELTLTGDMVSYDSYIRVSNSPYDTIYVNINIKSFSGIKKGDVAQITLPEELDTFPSPFIIRKRNGVDIGMASVNAKTNEVSFEFFKTLQGPYVEGNVGLYAKFKHPDAILPGRSFFKFVSQGVPTYRYLSFKKHEEASPKIRCRANGYFKWLDVYIPPAFKGWSSVKVTAATPAGSTMKKSWISVATAISLDNFGYSTAQTSLNETFYSAQTEAGGVAVELFKHSKNLTDSIITSFPFYYPSGPKAQQGHANVKIFANGVDITYNLECRFDASGMSDIGFTFSEM